MKVIETTALRLATGAFKTSPRVSLYAESNILPLPYWIKHRSINYFLKIQQSPLNHPLFQIFTQNVNRIWRTDWTTTKRIPFLARIKTIIQDFNLNIDKNAFTPIDTVSPVPPWRNLEDILKPTFAMPKDKTNSIEINKEFQKICREDYKDFLYIYTDGSLYEDPLSSAAGFYVEELDFSSGWKTPFHTIAGAELYAILKAIQWAARYFKNRDLVIFTDSKTALYLISNNDRSYRCLTEQILHNMKMYIDNDVKIKLQWIPSHKKI